MQRASRQRHADTLLTSAVVLLLVVSVAAIGSVHPATQLALSSGALAVFCCYGVIRGRAGFRPVPFSLVAAVGVAATLAQLIPLPASVVAFLSPPAFQLRAETAASHFFPLTVDAPATWLALARGAACAGLLVVTGSLVRSARHARRLLFIPAALGAALGIVGIVQRLAGVNSILGFYKPLSMPGVGIFGTFVDVNHAASVLALGLFAALGLAMGSSRRQSEIAIGCALSCGVALILTASRGALFGAAVAGFVLLATLIARRSGVVQAIIGAAAILLLASGALLWSHDQLRAKVSSPTALVDNQKTRGWAEAFRMAGDYRWTGVGRGAFASPIGAYRRADEGVRLVYPESILAQLASEWGIPVAILVIGLFLRTTKRVVRPLAKMPTAIVAGGCGVLAVLVHELFDFGLEFPGVAFPTVVTLAIVVGATRREENALSTGVFRLTPVRLAPLAAAWAVSLGGAAWAVRHTLDVDWSALHEADMRDAVDDGAVAAAISRHPADDFLELIAARAALRHDPTRAMHHLNRALVLHPANAQAHRMAAQLLIGAHRPAQAALEFRLAAQGGLTVPLPQLTAVLGGHVIETVEPTPAALDELAQQLYAINRRDEADAAARRAIDVAPAACEEPMRARIRLALAAHNRPVLRAAGNALAVEASSAESFATAAAALANAGDRAGTLAALAAGRKSFPDDSALVLAGAQAMLDLGDPAEARVRLEQDARVTFTLPQRQQAEELLAQVADKLGDPDTAAVARTRARLIARQLRDMNLSP